MGFAVGAVILVIEESLLNLQIAIREAGAEITVAAGLPTVKGERTELVRLFQNLIGNAVKYHLPDRKPAVSVTWRDGGKEWVVSVEDNGIGIDPRQFDRIFAMFQRLVAHDQYEGSGIGLAVCRKIAEYHGGRIRVESAPG